jgi:hypothetical protein
MGDPLEIGLRFSCMTSKFLERLDTDIQRLTLPEQVWLMERLAQSIRANTMREQQILESQIEEMAADPDIQREMALIQAEFEVADADGLTDDL